MTSRITGSVGPTAVATAFALMIAGCHASNPRQAQSDSPGAQGDTSSVQVEVEQFRSLANDPGSMSDKLFVLGEHRIGMRERALGEIVLERTRDPQIKELAKMVRDGHQLGVDRLRAVAADLKVTLPREITPTERANLEAIGNLPNEELTRFFLIRQRAMHAWDITIFTDFANVVVNESLKRYVVETLPPLRQHAEQVVQLANAKGVDGGLVAVGGGGKKNAAEAR